MKTAGSHIFISLAIAFAAALILTGGLWCAGAQAFAESPAAADATTPAAADADLPAGAAPATVPAPADSAPTTDPVPAKVTPKLTYTMPKNLHLLSGTFNLNAKTTNCDAELSYIVSEAMAEFIEIDQNGNLTILKQQPPYHAFYGSFTIYAAGTETSYDKMFTVPINVDWAPQKLTCPGSLKTTMGKSVTIKASAKGKLSYKSGNKTIATVSSTGKVKFLHPGKVTIQVKAANVGIYWSAEKNVTVTCKMTAPALKVTRPKKRCAKLTWSKVGGAQQYMVYVKYPGKSKYKPVLSRSAKVKSVTHKNLKKGRKYSYKVRAYLISGGDIYYGPFSKAATVKIK